MATTSFTRRRRTDERGQASVELVALLPLIVLLGALLVQGVLAGWALWSAGAGARAAARAQAIGAAPLAAARGALPAGLREEVSVRTDGEEVRVRVRVPRLVGGVPLGTVEARSRFTPQGGGA